MSMRHPGGYGVITDPQVGTPYQECDTFTCGHCHFVVFVPPRASAEDCGGLCKQCMRLICGPCVNRMVCLPTEELLRLAEARDATFRSIEETLGRPLAS